MSRRIVVLGALVMALVAVALAGVALAQEGGGGRRGGMRGGGFDRERFQQMMMERMRETLGAGEEEWTVIGPRLEKVMTLQREMRTGAGMRMMFGRRGRGEEAERPERPGQAEEEQSALEKATDSLQEALADEDTPAGQIKERLTAYRAAREKARQELDKAQKELREVLSVRQEAQLVLMGTLD